MAIEALDIEIRHKSEGADDAVQHLVGSLGKLSGILQQIGSAVKVPLKASAAFENIQRSSAAVATRGTKAVAAAKQEAASIDMLNERYQQLSRLVDFYYRQKANAEAFESENGKTDFTIDTRIKAIEKLQELIPQRNEAEDALRAAIEATSAAEEASAPAAEVAAEAREQLATVTKEVAEASEKAAPAVKEVSNAAEESNHSFLDAAAGVGKFVKMIGRMALYRAIRSSIRAVAQGVKEGTENFIAFDRATNQATSAGAIQTMSAFSGKMLELKNSIGAAAIPIMQALLPAFNAVANAAIGAANAIAAFFRVLGGSSTYFASGSTAAYDYADAMASAGGGASKLKNTLLGFDEINALNDNSGGGGGGGGGNWGGILPEDLFEEREVPPILAKLADAFRDLWSAVDALWNSKALEFIRSMLKGNTEAVLDGWATSIGGIAKVISGLADILNGDFLDGVNEMVEGVLDILAGIDQWGDSITEFYEKLSEKSFENVYKLLFGEDKEPPEWLTALADVIGWFNSRQSGSPVGDALLLFDGLGKVSDALKRIQETIDKFGDGSFLGNLRAIFSDPFLGADLSDVFFGGFYEKAKQVWESFKTSAINAWNKIKSVAKKVFDAISGFFSGPMEAAKEAKEQVSEFFNGLFGDVFGGDFTGAVERIKGLFTEIKIRAQMFVVQAKLWFAARKQAIIDWFENLPVVQKASEIVERFKSGFLATIAKYPWIADLLGIDTGAGGGVGANTLKSITFDTKLNLPPGGIEGFVKDRQLEADKEKPIGLKANIKQLDPPSSTPTIDVKASVESNVSGLKTQIQNAVSGLRAALGFKPYLVDTDLFVKINSGFNQSNQKISFRDITGYAEGGFPAAGLFLAGEAGPELVGTMGGRTAVANSDQIIAGITSGVMAAMAGTGAKLDRTNDLLQGMAERDSTVVVSTSDIAAGMSRMNRRAGATVMPVGA